MPNLDNKKFYIVREHPLRIISKCRSHSKGTLMSFLVGISLIYALLNWIPELLSIQFPQTLADLYSKTVTSDPEVLKALPDTYLVVVLYVGVFTGVFRFGEALFTLTYVRNRKVEIRAISEAFGYYFKAFGLFFVQGIIISLFSMLFVIPGIIAAINYSQAFYILAENPSKSILRVLAESRIMMIGNRMNYLRLLIYYIPYLMIAYIPAILISEIAVRLSIAGIPLLILTMAAEIPVFAANGYMSLGRCVFYELIINRGFADFKYAGQEKFRELESNK